MTLQQGRKINQSNHITALNSVKSYEKLVKELNKKHKKESIA